MATAADLAAQELRSILASVEDRNGLHEKIQKAIHQAETTHRILQEERDKKYKTHTPHPGPQAMTAQKRSKKVECRY